MTELVTKRDVARKYRVGERTVTNWMYKEKRISFLKIGRLVRFDLPTIDRELKDSGHVTAG